MLDTLDDALLPYGLHMNFALQKHVPLQVLQVDFLEAGRICELSASRWYKKASGEPRPMSWFTD